MKKRLIFVSILMVLFLTIFSSCAPSCNYCGGSGKCTKCKGTGKIVRVDEDGHYTIGHDECNICIGTGYCSYCQGQGKVY